MRIDEIFDNPYNWRWADIRGTAAKMFSAKVAAISLGDIVTALYPDRPSKMSAMAGNLAAKFEVEDDTIWVMFEKGKKGHWFVAFDSEASRMNNKKQYSNTNAGHPGKVLATVIEIIKDFMVHYQPEVMHFTAHDNKRASIYKAIVNKIGTYNKFKPHIEQRGNKGHAFTLSK